MTRYVLFNSRNLLIVLFVFSVICCGSAFPQTVIHVDNQNPAASDNNPGTSNLPMKTVSGGAKLADEINKNNTPVKVLVHPGTYRESVTIPFISDHSNTAAEIVFEAETKGSVIVSGSDIWTEWTKEAGNNLYSQNWPYNWGPVDQPFSDENLEEIVRRREMIFVDGKKLKQVLSLNDMEENSFYVSEDENKVYVRLSDGVNINTATVEVAVRSGIFVIDNRENITVRGFVFQHDNTGADGNAVQINNSKNILIEDCSFVWNNWGGLRFNGSENVTARRNVANHNGGRGMEAWRIKHLLFEDNITSFNNWRGVRGGFTAVSVAGLKHMRIHDGTYKNHMSIGNHSRGFWLDFDCSDITIEGAIWKDNLEAGIAIEADQGPVTITDSAICNNNEYGGITTNQSENVTVRGNVIYGNVGDQLHIRGTEDTRTVNNWETGEEYNLLTKNWVVENNVIQGVNSSQDLLDVKDTPADSFVDTVVSNNNVWYNADNADVFVANGRHNFNGWKSITGQDSDSVFQDPDSASLNAQQRELLNICLDEASVSIFSVRAEVISHETAQITWSTSDLTDSQVEYGADSSYGSRTSLDQSLVSEHRVLLTGLSPETTYHFRVISKDEDGNIHVSGDFTFVTPVFSDNSPPTAPTVLTAIVISQSQINLSWGASIDNVGVSGYRIYRDGSAVKTIPDTYYSDTGLEPSTAYRYTVTAMDSAGNESEHSSEATAITYADSSGQPPEAPSNLEVNTPAN